MQGRAEVARQPHKLKNASSILAPATKFNIKIGGNMKRKDFFRFKIPYWPNKRIEFNLRKMTHEDKKELVFSIIKSKKLDIHPQYNGLWGLTDMKHLVLWNNYR